MNGGEPEEVYLKRLVVITGASCLFLDLLGRMVALNLALTLLDMLLWRLPIFNQNYSS